MKLKMQLFIIMLMIGFQSHAQEKANNFSIDERGILWQKVFETELTFTELTEKLKGTGIFERMEIGDNKIYGHTNLIFPNYQAAGFAYIEAQNIFTEYYYLASILIEYKGSKYRVTIRNLQITSKVYDPKGKSEVSNLELYALKNGKNEMTTSFKKSASLILDYTFTKSFEIKNNSDQDNW